MVTFKLPLTFTGNTVRPHVCDYNRSMTPSKLVGGRPDVTPLFEGGDGQLD
jgi:hypothetical protein